MGWLPAGVGQARIVKSDRVMHTKLVVGTFATLLSSSALVMACAMEAQQPQQPRSAPSAEQPVNPDAAAIKDFKDRIEAYLKVRGKMEEGAARPKETADPAKIRAAQDALATRIQAARRDAKPGDIFTPEIRNLFRRLMYPELKGPDGNVTKKTITEVDHESKETPPKSKILRVNARYPESAPLPTVPPNLLARLPQLPEELEYRIVNTDLILRDVNANLIVDFIPNAIH
jgi:hypothetical protein